MPARAPLAALAGPALRVQTDARLVTLSREGHGRAFEEIVRRYRAPLVRFAGAIVPADRAEDVVQEAFTRAHGAITASEADLALRPWLYRVVRNGALNDLRDHRWHEEIDPEYDGVPQPPEIAARREELGATVAAIAALPAAQRDAIVKRELEGLGHEEIAAELGVTPGAVRQLIFRARTTLRNGLGSLVPLPVVRAMLETGPAGAGTAGAAGGGAAALGLAGGGGIALKAGTAALIALAIGSGLALRDDHQRGADLATAATADAGPAVDARGHAGRDTGRGSETAEPGTGDHDGNGPGGDGRSGEDRDDSGPSGSSEGGEHSGGGQSGPGRGGDYDDNSGPGGGGDDDYDDNSGPGGGGEDDYDDNSGPGGGDLPDTDDGNSGPGGDDDPIETERHQDSGGDDLLED